VFDNIEKKVIWGVFTELFGRDAIDRIDVVFKETPNGEKYKRVFVHFRAWPTTYESQLVRRKLLDGQEIKIVYDEPWFWKCSASRIEKPATREKVVTRPYVDVSSSTKREFPPNNSRDNARGSFRDEYRKPVLAQFVPRQVANRQKSSRESASSEKASEKAE